MLRARDTFGMRYAIIATQNAICGTPPPSHITMTVKPTHARTQRREMTVKITRNTSSTGMFSISRTATDPLKANTGGIGHVKMASKRKISFGFDQNYRLYFGQGANRKTLVIFVCASISQRSCM